MINVKQNSVVGNFAKDNLWASWAQWFLCCVGWMRFACIVDSVVLLCVLWARFSSFLPPLSFSPFLSNFYSLRSPPSFSASLISPLFCFHFNDAQRKRRRSSSMTVATKRNPRPWGTWLSNGRDYTARLPAGARADTWWVSCELRWGRGRGAPPCAPHARRQRHS